MRLRHLAPPIVAFFLSGILLSACAASGYVYVQSADGRAFFKIPREWKTYQKQDLLVSTGLDDARQANQEFKWLVAFDSNPHPSLAEVIDIGHRDQYPVVYAYQRQLDPLSRDTMSLETIRNLYYPIDRLLQSNAAEILSTKDISRVDGLHGSQILYNVALNGNFSVVSGNDVLTVTQAGVVDTATQNVYFFAIRCTADCYKSNESLINQIISSWTTKER